MKQTQIFVTTGPESCGKTTLAEQLARHYDCPLTPEESRRYLDEKMQGRPGFSYQENDLLKIAQRQSRAEHNLITQCPDHLICDTDLLVIMIWSEVKYGRCDPWILQSFEKALRKHPRHYLLCHWEIPWHPDPLRENPRDRENLFDRYLEKLKDYRLNYSVLRGNEEQRLQQALTLSPTP